MINSPMRKLKPGAHNLLSCQSASQSSGYRSRGALKTLSSPTLTVFQGLDCKRHSLHTVCSDVQLVTEAERFAKRPKFPPISGSHAIAPLSPRNWPSPLSPCRSPNLNCCLRLSHPPNGWRKRAKLLQAPRQELKLPPFSRPPPPHLPFALCPPPLRSRCCREQVRTFLVELPALPHPPPQLPPSLQPSSLSPSFHPPIRLPSHCHQNHSPPAQITSVLSN